MTMPRVEYESIVELISRRDGDRHVRAVVSSLPGTRDTLALELILYTGEEDDAWTMKRRKLVDHDAISTVSDLRWVGDTLQFTTDAGTDEASKFQVRVTPDAFETKPTRIEDE